MRHRAAPIASVLSSSGRAGGACASSRRRLGGALLIAAALVTPTVGWTSDGAAEHSPSAEASASCPIDLRGLEGRAGGSTRRLRRMSCARRAPLIRPGALGAAPRFAAKQAVSFTPKQARRQIGRAAGLAKHANGLRRRVEARLDRARPAARSAATDARVQADLGGGKTGFGSGSSTRAPEGMTGHRAEVEIGIVLKKDDFTGKFAMRLVDKAFVATCPTAAGEVKGSRTLLFGSRITMSDENVVASADWEVRLDVEYEGQVGPDAKLNRYDYRSTATVTGKGAARAGGKTYGGGSEVYRGFDSAKGVPIGDGKVPEGDALRDAIVDAIESGRLGAWGPKGKLGRDAGAEQENTYIALGSAVLGRYFAAEDLLNQQEHWYDKQACAQVEAPPDHFPGRRGETVTWSSTVKAAGGKPVAASQTASTTCPGKLSPTSAQTGPGVPAQFSISDTQNRWTPTNTPCIRIDALSRAGKAHQKLGYSIEEPPPKYPASWSGTARGTVKSDGITEGWSANLRLVRETESDGYAGYDATGQISWSISGTNSNGCSVSGAGTFPVAATGLGILDRETDPIYTFFIRRSAGETQTVNLSGPTDYPHFCKNESTSITPLNMTADWARTEYPPGSAKYNGETTLKGTRSYVPSDNDGVQVEWGWELTAGG